jgi:hypothetical protein
MRRPDSADSVHAPPPTLRRAWAAARARAQGWPHPQTLLRHRRPFVEYLLDARRPLDVVRWRSLRCRPDGHARSPGRLRPAPRAGTSPPHQQARHTREQSDMLSTRASTRVAVRSALAASTAFARFDIAAPVRLRLPLAAWGRWAARPLLARSRRPRSTPGKARRLPCSTWRPPPLLCGLRGDRRSSRSRARLCRSLSAPALSLYGHGGP